MSSDRLAIERAAWGVAIKAYLQPDFKCQERMNDYSTTFVVSHTSCPAWKVNIAVTSGIGARNRVEIDGEVFSYSFSSAMRYKLAGFISSHLKRFMEITDETRQQEAVATGWVTRQRTELHSVKEISTVTATIICSGPHAGKYAVRLHEGNPLEHLTLDQVKAFHEFLHNLDPQSVSAPYFAPLALPAHDPLSH